MEELPPSAGSWMHVSLLSRYRGTLLIRNSALLGPYRRPMPRVLGGSWGGGRSRFGEVPLYGMSHESSGSRGFELSGFGFRSLEFYGARFSGDAP